ncbi:hypothetical protein BGW39_005049, partial [Mortierella sp. 14UC]
MSTDTPPDNTNNDLPPIQQLVLNTTEADNNNASFDPMNEDVDMADQQPATSISPSLDRPLTSVKHKDLSLFSISHDSAYNDDTDLSSSLEEIQ